jgi:hypothetical protein
LFLNCLKGLSEKDSREKMAGKTLERKDLPPRLKIVKPKIVKPGTLSLIQSGGKSCLQIWETGTRPAFANRGLGN